MHLLSDMSNRFFRVYTPVFPLTILPCAEVSSRL